MQTFLPYADFEASARALDQKRLGKQRVETIQVVRALTVPGYGWANHPAALMWRGFEEALGRYGITCCEVWLELGFGDTCAAWPVRSQAVIEAERRRAENAVRREQRAAERLLADAERARRRRSRAAKKAWATRRRNARETGS